MQEIAMVDGFLKARYTFFKWRCSLSFVNKFILALGVASLTGLMAQIKFFLPWTPVPITCQTLAVLLAGVILGRSWGGISQVIYVTLGVIGIPWFAGMSGGVGALVGPTGGYLIGFILAAFFIGHFTDKYIRARSFVSMFALMLFANFVIIHLLGLLQLGIWFQMVKGTGITFWKLLQMGTTPFIIGDLAKIAAAAVLAKTITPNQPYNNEIDAPR